MITLFGVLVITAGIAMIAAGLTSRSFIGEGVLTFASPDRKPWIGRLIFYLLGAALIACGTLILLEVYAVL
jgi:hypothetical protein